MTWRAVYTDGHFITDPDYADIDRSTPFRFELYEPLVLKPFLSVPVGKGWRLVQRTRHRSAPGMEFKPQTIVAVENEDRSDVAVWVVEDPPFTMRRNGYGDGIYAPELYDYEKVTG